MPNLNQGFNNLDKSWTDDSILKAVVVATIIVTGIISCYLFLPYFVDCQFKLLYKGGNHENLYNLSGIILGILTLGVNIANVVYLKLNFKNSNKLFQDQKEERILLDSISLLDNNIENVIRHNSSLRLYTNKEGLKKGADALQMLDNSFQSTVKKIENLKSAFTFSNFSTDELKNIQDHIPDIQSVNFYYFYYQQNEALYTIFALHFEISKEIIHRFNKTTNKSISRLLVENNFIKFFSNVSVSQKSALLIHISKKNNVKLYQTTEDLYSINAKEISVLLVKELTKNESK